MKRKAYEVAKKKGYEFCLSCTDSYSPDEWLVNDDLDFCDGYTMVSKGYEYNFINPDGQLLSPYKSPDCTYLYIYHDFHNGFAIINVNDRDVWNYIDKNGQLLGPNMWFESDRSFKHGFAAVEKNGKYNFINTKGEILSLNRWFDDTFVSDNGILEVRKNGKWYYIYPKKEMLDYDVKKSLIRYRYIDEIGKYKRGIGKGYKCANDKDQFDIRYEPIKMYGIRHVLCLNNDSIFLYDRENVSYKKIGYVSEIEFDDYFIINNKNKKVYFIYENKVYDITEYYQSRNMRKSKLQINKGVSIISKEDFFYKNEDEIRKLYDEEKQQDEKRVKRQNDEKNKLKIVQLEQKREEEEERLRKEKHTSLTQILEGFKKMKKLKKK